MTDEIRLNDGPKELRDPIEAHLLEARTVMITGQIGMEMATKGCARLHAMAQISDDPIKVIVSSPGGHVESGNMIHDTLKFIRPEITMIGMGWVASAGALIFVAADKERRLCTPNTRFLLHQPSGAAGGQASDVEIQTREILRMRERLNKIFAEATGQPLKRIAQDTDRDYWMSAEEAIEYGLCDRVVEHVGDVA